MSDQAIDAAVEQILADREYAQQVYENPEQALTSRFDLEPGEWRSIAWCLREDVDASLGDTRGHSIERIGLGAVDFQLLRRVPSLKGSFDRAGEEPTKTGR